MLQVQEFGFQCTPFHIRYPGLRDVCVFQIAAPAQECETRAKIVKTLRSADSVQAARQVSVLMPGTEPEIAFNEQSRDLLVIKKNSSNEGIEEAFGTVQLAVGSGTAHRPLLILRSMLTISQIHRTQESASGYYMSRIATISCNCILMQNDESRTARYLR